MALKFTVHGVQSFIKGRGLCSILGRATYLPTLSILLKLTYTRVPERVICILVGDSISHSENAFPLQVMEGSISN